MAITLINITRNRDNYTFIYSNGFEDTVNLSHENLADRSRSNLQLFKSPQTGKNIKSIPKCAETAVGRIIDLFRVREYTLTRKFLDELLSLPNISFDIKEDYLKILPCIRTEYSKADWRYFIQNIDNKRETQYYYYNHSGIAGMAKFYNALSNVKEEDRQIIDFVRKYFSSNSIVQFAIAFNEVKCFRAEARKIYKDYKEIADKYMAIRAEVEEMIKEYNWREVGIEIKPFTFYGQCVNKMDTLLHRYEKCLQFIKLMNIKNYKFTNIERDLNDLSVTWDREKTRIENENFAKNQTKYNLSYENELYKIAIPTNREELAHIGHTFNNCANSYEWNNYLADGDRYLVVVIQKIGNKMVACVDMREYDLEITQFLGKNNLQICDNSLLSFKEEYQNYLSSLVAVN